MPYPQSPREAKMAQLMQLLQVVQASQYHQGELGNQQAQLAQTGLFHQGELQQQANTLAQTGLFHQGELSNQQAQLEELARYHQGEMNHQQAMDALGIRQANSADAQHQALIQAQKDSESNRMNMEFMTHLMNNPNVPIDKALQALGALDPRFSKVGQVMHEGAVQSAIQSQTPAVQGMYDMYNKGHDYGQLQKGLAALQSSIPNKEVFNGLPWESLNAAMTNPPATTFSPAPVDPKVISDQRDQESQGGLFGRGGFFDMRNQYSPEQEASVNQAMQDSTKLPGPFSFLFGASPEQLAFKKQLEQEQALQQYNKGKMLLK